MPGEPRAAQELLSYRPQAKQRKLIEAAGLLEWWEGRGERRHPKGSIVGYGGAAYGGKTYGFLGLAAIWGLAWPGSQIAFFRRTYAEIEGAGGAMRDAHNVFIGEWVRKEAGRQWDCKNGSNFYFQHCEHETDVYKYAGKQFDLLIVDEATTFSWEMIDFLMTRNRATVEGMKPLAVMGSNPGNIGHAWYMGVFSLEGLREKIEAGVYDEPMVVRNPNNKWTKVFFIPAFLEDNVIGTERDPEYAERLEERDPATARALLKGDWGAFTGQAFGEFDAERHVIAPFEIPDKWPKWRAVDGGWDHPFCCGWFAMNPVSGRVYIYRELLESKMTDQEQAIAVASYTPHTEWITTTWADPAMWSSKNVAGIVSTAAGEYIKNGIFVMKADNDRMLGYKKVHNLLAEGADGEPMLQIFSSCVHLIGILPKLSRAEGNVEDVKKQDGDDPYDMLRYGLTNIAISGGVRKRKKDKATDPWKKLGNLL